MIDQGLINHVALVLDASSSMNHLRNEVVTVADGQVASLADLSTKMDQETRATVYTFSYPNNIDCAYYDKDVLRMMSLKNKYTIGGNTALIDATMKSIEDLEKTATLYGDHAFLVYILTDGEENASRKYGARELEAKISNLPDNWTVAALVPDVSGEAYARRVGFLPGNIAIWSTTTDGVQEVGRTIQTATQNFMQARAVGQRGSKNLFQASTKDFSSAKKSLIPLASNMYEILAVGSGETRQIRDFVEQESTKRKQYRKGCAFYQLTKTEEVQPSKTVAILDTADNKLYTGADARTAIGIPHGQYVEVKPENHADKIIFVQSTSVNRKLAPNTLVVVM